MTRTLVKAKDDKPHTKKSASSSTPSPQNPEDGFDVAEYFKGVKQEWHKISWPSRPQIIAETGIVLVMVTIFTIFVFVVDKIIAFIINLIT